MDLRKLKTLIDLVESSGIAELEISEGEERVRITRTPTSAMQMPVHHAAQPQQVIVAAPAAVPRPPAPSPLWRWARAWPPATPCASLKR
jgi:acetyl-CoA carboxylase biotin carboxyl carrier protein